ncbi:hypothetical protein BH10PAT1_BH10PAT1_3610 [soil metagenome]
MAELMLKNLKSLVKEFPQKGRTTYVAMSLIALPITPINIPAPVEATVTVQNTIAAQSQSLLISQAQLNIAFNVQDNTKNSSIKQIPIDFIYMSQGFSAFHPGVDLATKFGTQILPFEAGIVTQAGYSPFGYGNEVIIDNGNGIESLYAHLSRIDVKKGDRVTVNTEIGLVGSTGHSTGPHLHFEIHKDGVPINPVSILPDIKTSGTLLTSK